MAHLYTFNPLSGLSAGIPMNIGAPVPNNPSRKAPPHLSVGLAGFIQVNSRWQNAQFDSGKLLRSSLTQIEPDGKRAFFVFDVPRQEDDFNSLIFIDTSVPKNMKLRADTGVNAWTGIRGEGIEVVLVDTSTGTALLRCESNATIELFQFDGSIHLISVVNGKVSTVPLAQKQMAHLRVEQFEEQIATLNLSLERGVRRLHGIIAGALRLVPVVKDRDALDVLVDFFISHQVKLTDNLRKQVRWALADASHPAAGTFLDGFDGANVIRMNNSDGAARRANLARKRERAERERAACLARKGKSGGGQQQTAGKKARGKK